MQETRRNLWKKHLWDCIVRWDRAAGMFLAPVFPNFSSWQCSLFKKQLYRCHFTMNIQLGQGFGLKGVSMPWAQVLRLISAPPPLPPELICLVLVASSQTPFSSPNPLSTCSPPPRLLILAQIVFPLHLSLVFHAAVGVSWDPRDAAQASCPTHWESPVLQRQEQILA